MILAVLVLRGPGCVAAGLDRRISKRRSPTALRNAELSPLIVTGSRRKAPRNWPINQIKSALMKYFGAGGLPRRAIRPKLAAARMGKRGA
jgi:hypothetical protein